MGALIGPISFDLQAAQPNFLYLWPISYPVLFGELGRAFTGRKELN
jgi:hypothetical protein